MPMPTRPKRTVSLGATARNLIGASDTPAAAALSSMNSRRDQLRGGRCVMGALPEIRLGENNALLLMVLSSVFRSRAWLSRLPRGIRAENADPERERAQLLERRADPLAGIDDVEVEQILPGPAGERARLDCRQIPSMRGKIAGTGPGRPGATRPGESEAASCAAKRSGSDGCAARFRR